MAKLDTGGDGTIDKAEFVAWWTGRTAGLGGKLSRVAARGKKENYTDIHVASWRGDAKTVRRFLAMDPDLKNALDETDYGCGYARLAIYCRTIFL